MTPPTSNFPAGYVVVSKRHGQTILQHDYPEEWAQLQTVLDGFNVHIDEAIAGGRGKGPMTKRLENSFRDIGWKKEKMTIRSRVTHQSGAIRDFGFSPHELDHFRAFTDDRHGLALEIEWNSKDVSFDRDLAAFPKLHSLELISVGIIITRSTPLQEKLYECFSQKYRNNPALANNWLKNKSAATKRRIRDISDEGARLAEIGRSAAQSKYGASTSHWGKLMERIDKDLGAPCPLVLIGIGAERLIED